MFLSLTDVEKILPILSIDTLLSFLQEKYVIKDIIP